LQEDSLGSQMSKPQLLKRKWSEDMTQNVRMARESLCESRGESVRKRATNILPYSLGAALRK
jgi:hypothetical protein